MEWLNYHHLLYFWATVHEGGVTAAAAKLRLAPATVSAQIQTLQSALGEKLLIRSGRKHRLTQMGQIVYRYADDIFRLGQEMLDTVRDRPTGRPLLFTVGIADGVPKQLARQLLRPVEQLQEDVRLVCREGNPERLLIDLAAHSLDLLLLDAPIPPSAGVRVSNHLLVECRTSLLATEDLVAKYRRKPLRALNGAPFLLATGRTSQRRGLDEWFERNDIRPTVVAEFDDNGLLREFAREGMGIFAVPTTIERTYCRQLGVRVLLRLPDITERFYAVTAERQVKHPAVTAVCSGVFQEKRKQ